MNDKLIKRVVWAFLIGEAVATIVWLLLIIPSVLWWKQSIIWIVIMSAWANFAGHAAGLVSAMLALYEYKSNNK